MSFDSEKDRARWGAQTKIIRKRIIRRLNNIILMNDANVKGFKVEENNERKAARTKLNALLNGSDPGMRTHRTLPPETMDWSFPFRYFCRERG